jgi:hypothetical protein
MLARERSKETRALADHHPFTACADGVEHLAGAVETAEEWLGTNRMLARLERANDVIRMKMIGRVDAHDINGRICEQGIDGVGSYTGGQTKFHTTLLTKRFVEITESGNLPEIAVYARRDNAAALAESEDAESEFFHGLNMFGVGSGFISG